MRPTCLFDSFDPTKMLPIHSTRQRHAKTPHSLEEDIIIIFSCIVYSRTGSLS
jgi:hypothetical protein